MNERFEGKVGLLTGGAKGIGRATALRFLAEGGLLAVVDKEPEDGDLADALRRDAGQAANRLCYVQAEATEEAAVEAAVATAKAQIGAPDVLVNNVGFGANPRPIEDLSLAEWNEFLSINLNSMFLVSRAVVPEMRAKGGGRIVNLASVAGRSVSSMSNLHYSTSKAAVLGFTRKLAHEEGPHGISVNSVCPGTTFTERVETRFRALPQEVQDQRLGSVPLRRAARPEEIAACILFLASEDASYVTGAALDVNGGCFMS